PKFLKELYVTPGTTEHSTAKVPPSANGGSNGARKSAEKLTPSSSAKSSAKSAPSSSAKSGGKTLAEEIRAFALSFPETREDMPWGHPAFKVKNKMFATMSFKEHGMYITVKLTESRLAASALPFVKPTGYGLSDHGWVTCDLKLDEKRISI